MLIILLLLFFYQLFTVTHIFYNIIRIRKKKKSEYSYITISKRAYFSISIISLFLSFLLSLNLQDVYAGVSTISDLLEAFIFFGAWFLLSVYIVFACLLWKIEYNNEIMLFRNSFGIKRRYELKYISTVDKKMQTIINYKDKKITDYTVLVMDIDEIIAFERALYALNNIQTNVIPYAGILLSFAASFIVSILIDNYFTSNRKKQLATIYMSKTRNNKNSISSFAKVLSYIFDFFVKIAQTAGTMSKDVENIVKLIKRAKSNGASKEWIDELNKRKKKLLSHDSLGTGKISTIAKLLGLFASIFPYLSYININYNY